MKNTKILSLALAAALAVGMLSGCGTAASSAAASSAAASSAAASSAAASSAASSAAGSAASAAAVKVTFTVVGADGASKEYALDAVEGETLADALSAAGLISADEAAAGFVTTVDGVAADYNKDQSWWKMVDGKGEMTANGIGDIQLKEGDSYSFVYTIGA